MLDCQAPNACCTFQLFIVVGWAYAQFCTLTTIAQLRLHILHLHMYYCYTPRVHDQLLIAMHALMQQLLCCSASVSGYDEDLHTLPK